MGVEQDLPHHHPPAAPEDATQLGQRAPLVGDLAKRGDQVGSVEVAVRVG